MATVTKIATGAAVASAVFTNGSWTNEANARVATTDLTAAGSNTYATVTNAGRNKEFASLWPFAFSTSDIPDGATINSVSVKLQWKNSVNSTNYTLRSAAFDGSNDSTAAALSANPGVTRSPTPTADTDDTYSLTTVPSLTQLRNGIWIRASALQGGTNTGSTFSLDYIQVTVDYTPPSTSGTVAVTEDVDTSTASGAQNNRASAAITEAVDTPTVSGTVNNRGTVTTTEAADTSSASGIQGYTGTASAIEADDVTGSRLQLDGYGIENASTIINLDSTVDGYGQTFVSSVAAFVTSTSFDLIRSTDGAGTLVSKIYETPSFGGNIPSGPALSTSAQVDIATKTSTIQQMVEFTFPGDLQLAPGVLYVASIELVGGSVTGSISVGIDNTSPTHPGTRSSRITGSWFESGQDLIFSVNSVGQGASGTVTQPPVTGTIGVTEAADTASASGAATVVGTSSTTEAADTPSASATITVTGSVAATESDDTVSASGDVQTPTIDGFVTVTEAADVSSITAIVTLTGTISIAEADDTSAVVALATNLGAIAVTEQSDTLTGTGRAGDILASESSVETNDAASASGFILVAGTITLTEANDTSAVSGTIKVSGSVAVTEAADTSSVVAKLIQSGTISVTEQSDTSSVNAKVIVSGTVTTTEAADISDAQGGIPAAVSGTITVTEQADALSGSGFILVIGSDTTTEGVDTSTATGIVQLTGQIAVTEALDIASVAGIVRVSGAASVTESADTASTTAVVQYAGSASVTEQADTVVATGLSRYTGSVTITEAADTPSAAGIVRVTGAIAVTESLDIAQAVGVNLIPVTGTASITEGDDRGVALAFIPVEGSPTRSSRKKTVRTKVRVELPEEWQFLENLSLIPVIESALSIVQLEALESELARTIKPRVSVRAQIRHEPESVFNARALVRPYRVKGRIRMQEEMSSLTSPESNLVLAYNAIYPVVNLSVRSRVEVPESAIKAQSQVSDPLLEEVVMFIASSAIDEEESVGLIE